MFLLDSFSSCISCRLCTSLLSSYMKKHGNYFFDYRIHAISCLWVFCFYLDLSLFQCIHVLLFYLCSRPSISVMYIAATFRYLSFGNANLNCFFVRRSFGTAAVCSIANPSSALFTKEISITLICTCFVSLWFSLIFFFSFRF